MWWAWASLQSSSLVHTHTHTLPLAPLLMRLWIKLTESGLWISRSENSCRYSLSMCVCYNEVVWARVYVCLFYTEKQILVTNSKFFFIFFIAIYSFVSHFCCFKGYIMINQFLGLIIWLYSHFIMKTCCNFQKIKTLPPLHLSFWIRIWHVYMSTKYIRLDTIIPKH